MSTLQDKYAFGSFELIPDRGVLLLDGVPVPMGSRAVKILTILAQQAGKVVNGQEISMGTLDWQYDAQSHILKSENANGTFRFVVDHEKMEGTLILPDATIYRRIHLARLK